MDKRVTVRLPTTLFERVDRAVERGQYRNRSDAIRDAIKSMDAFQPERPRAVTDGGSERYPDELQAVLSSGDENPVCNGVYRSMDTAVDALVAIPADGVIQPVRPYPETELVVCGHELTARRYPARYPGEPDRVEIQCHEPVKHGYKTPRRWRYVFKLRNWSNTVRLDGEGVHATLTYVYAAADDADPAGPEGYETVAVNGGTQVPAFVREAVSEHADVEGFGRPPFIRGRDDESSGLAPEPEAVTDGGGQA